MRNFCESLREHSVKISNFENNKMIPLTNKDPCHYKGKYRGFANYICKFKGSIPKEIPMFFLMNWTMIIIFLL